MFQTIVLMVHKTWTAGSDQVAHNSSAVKMGHSSNECRLVLKYPMRGTFESLDRPKQANYLGAAPHWLWEKLSVAIECGVKQPCCFSLILTPGGTASCQILWFSPMAWSSGRVSEIIRTWFLHHGVLWFQISKQASFSPYKRQQNHRIHFKKLCFDHLKPWLPQQNGVVLAETAI